ncbi:MAG: replication protein C [Rhodospirillales bacterium]|nr:replication protein C [Rhodospirillales bacterium]
MESVQRFRAPTGFRRLSAEALDTLELTKRFAGLPESITNPHQLLSVLKRGALPLGVPGRVLQLIDRLFAATLTQDWESDSRPIVWLSNDRLKEDLGIGMTQLKSAIRRLGQLRLVAMRDSPNGRRYGYRDRTGRIVEAYGFDLSPLAVRYAELLAVAESAAAEREARTALRRRASIARRAAYQLLETAAEYRESGAELDGLEAAADRTAAAGRSVRDIADLETLVVSFEERVEAVRNWLQSELRKRESDPKRADLRPRIIPTNDPQACESATVNCSSKPSSASSSGDLSAATRSGIGREVEEDPRIAPSELLRLAPRLADAVPVEQPTWADVVDGADRLRHVMGISKPLWGRACTTIGRYRAAIAVAIVSTKPEASFRSSPGAYFHGMIARAEQGELYLERSIFGLRERTYGPRRVHRPTTRKDHDLS